MSSWLGASVLSLGEWFIKRMPFVRHIYNASKQISAAISPGLWLLFGIMYVGGYLILNNFIKDPVYCIKLLNRPAKHVSGFIYASSGRIKRGTTALP